MSGEFAGKVMVVTGAGEGLGQALTRELYNAGAKVYGISLEIEPLIELKKECPTIEITSFDLKDWNTTRESLKSFLKGVKVDGLVNNAGVTICKPFLEFTEADYDFVMDINAKAVFNVTQTVLPHMNDGGSIVNLSSCAGIRAFQDHVLYSGSKSAVDGFTRVLALELGPRNIRCNSVCPTAVMTQMGRRAWADPDKAEKLTSRIPLRRFGEVREVTEPIMFLLSNRSSFINGHHLPIEGGYAA